MNINKIINIELFKKDLEKILFDLGKEIKIHKIDQNIILDINYTKTINQIINILQKNIIN